MNAHDIKKNKKGLNLQKKERTRKLGTLFPQVQFLFFKGKFIAARKTNLSKGIDRDIFI